MFRVIASIAFATFHAVKADLAVYTDGAGTLASGWENWSWGSDINFAATDQAAIAGGSSISVNSTAYSALSVYYEGTLTGFAGLRFDISGSQPDLTISIQATGDGASSPSITLASINSDVVDGTFSSLLINFADLPGSNAQLGNDTWNRINFQAGGNGAYYHIDNIVLVTEIVIPPAFLSAEPFATNLIGVTTQGAAIQVVNQTTYVPVDTPALSITYLTLASAFKSGSLTITAGNSSFAYTLPAVQQANVQYQYNRQINPHIYGVNFPTDAGYIQHLGVTISRWGGNAVTAYNPFSGVTNAGNDWYFENRVSDYGSADDWMGWVEGAGSEALLTVPALDWVSKDSTSYSYPKSLYPDQESFDPYNGEAGDGLYPNGTTITPAPSQSNVYSSWNTTLAKQWLSGLTNKPLMVAIDNEIEITSSTHQDMHPTPMSYDEELSRVIATATAAKEAIPDVLVVAPSTCSWWYYWTSIVGFSDNTAHNNTDFLPWFLAQMSQQHLSSGKRLLDYLDIHYYFQADTSANDEAARALRLRMTRSLWDPTYVDESWIGTSPPQSQQPNATIVQLIPRMQQLIAENYSGTKLSISEWSSTNDTDITGGLVTADSLGIFGKYGVDSATYWSEPAETGPVGLAYWLYRGYDTQFGSISVAVTLDNPLPDTQGLYAATENGKLSLVIVNKNPDTPIAFSFENVPPANYFLRHFGGEAGVAKWQTTTFVSDITYIVVPAYTAIFLQQQ
ncbi:glycoside hydrolase family 44-domain-containing protein [Gymnopilus junonius]|uniref:Glycoside hydrolase family 44-domain-containing protein n=1 Tax=Gymnopilus junonius TaxID=109634 RepID=A0A9P5NFX7_GYMJU|nr:glycoside hydrolase family 44-domain-containing protein [Gymnopilus junonius]